MTPSELKSLCDFYGGQNAVAKTIDRHLCYVNRMVHGKDKITNIVIHKLYTSYPEYFTKGEDYSLL